MAAKKSTVTKATEAVKDAAKTVVKAADRNVVKPVKKAAASVAKAADKSVVTPVANAVGLSKPRATGKKK